MHLIFSIILLKNVKDNNMGVKTQMNLSSKVNIMHLIYITKLNLYTKKTIINI